MEKYVESVQERPSTCAEIVAITHEIGCRPTCSHYARFTVNRRWFLCQRMTMVTLSFSFLEFAEILRPQSDYWVVEHWFDVSFFIFFISN